MNFAYYFSYLLSYIRLVIVYFVAPHPVTDCDTKVQRLVDMGIAESEARNSLSKHNWDLEKTTEYLFS